VSSYMEMLKDLRDIVSEGHCYCVLHRSEGYSTKCGHCRTAEFLEAQRTRDAQAAADGLVGIDEACPRCNERRQDSLVFVGDGVVKCSNCGTVYQPGEPKMVIAVNVPGSAMPALTAAGAFRELLRVYEDELRQLREQVDIANKRRDVLLKACEGLIEVWGRVQGTGGDNEVRRAGMAAEAAIKLVRGS